MPTQTQTAPANCALWGNSSKRIMAKVIAKNGVRLPSAPVKFGPTSEFEKKVNSVTPTGKVMPTITKIAALPLF